MTLFEVNMRIQDMKKSIVKLIAASLIVSAAFGTASCGTHSTEPAEVNTKTESEILSAVEGEVQVAADGSERRLPPSAPARRFPMLQKPCPDLKS